MKLLVVSTLSLALSLVSFGVAQAKGRPGTGSSPTAPQAETVTRVTLQLTESQIKEIKNGATKVQLTASQISLLESGAKSRYGQISHTYKVLVVEGPDVIANGTALLMTLEATRWIGPKAIIDNFPKR